MHKHRHRRGRSKPARARLGVRTPGALAPGYAGGLFSDREPTVRARAWAADGRTDSHPCTWLYCDADDTRAWVGALRSRLLDAGKRIAQVPVENQSHPRVMAAKAVLSTTKSRLDELDAQWWCSGISIRCLTETNELIEMQASLNDVMDHLAQFGVGSITRPKVLAPDAKGPTERAADAVSTAIVLGVIAVGGIYALSKMK